MVKVYKARGEDNGIEWVREDGEVLAERPATGGFTVPTALVLIPSGPNWQVLACAARATGSYEWMSWCDPAPVFETRADALAHAEGWA